ncbi:MAG TPA: ComEC/Rec2 family competence protein [Candidatus Udaeobacter sp.]|jgi:ComEC/Rec2-related protein|nr:ComEC/Rec2 family competence protein [Candidatus Udaeobacter sp.]
MKLLSAPRQPFVGLALMAATGIIAAEIIPLSLVAVTAAVIILALCILSVARWPRLLATYAIVGAGFFLLHSFQNSSTEGQQLADQLGNRPRVVTATGTVITEPKIAPSGFATFLLKLKSVELEGRKQSAHAVWQVRWKGAPEFGDELELSGTAEPIPPPRNPGEFDMRSYLARRDVRRMLFVRYPENGTLIRHGGGNPIMRAAQKSRTWMQNTLCRGLEGAPEAQNFLSGIVLGLRRQTPEDIEEPFQQTGTLHLFAVAGLHVGIVATLLWMLATVARLSRKSAAALIIPLLLFYAAVTGLHISSVRAAVMSSILLGGFFFDRKAFVFNSLAAAAFFLLCWDTNELFSTGFQLSFAVVGAIILLAEPLSTFLQHWSAPDPFLPRSLVRGPRRWMHAGFDWLCDGSSVSLAAWAGSLPLILWYFHLVTPISLFANLVVVPMAFFVIAIALLSLVSAPLLPWLTVIFNNANWALATLVIGVVHLFAQIPGGHFYVEQPHWPEKLVAKITVLDLGAGATVHLQTEGANWLFDCGNDRGYERVVREYLHWAGVNRLSGLLLTHGDALHLGGTAQLLDDFPRIRVLDNPTPDRSTIHRRLQRLFQEREIKPAALAAGDSFRLSREVTAHVLFPPRIFSSPVADDQAYVIRVLVGPAASILFMSDAGIKTEQALLARHLDLRSDIVVKGQHHSGESGSAAFLDAASPRLVIASSRDFPDHERISDTWAEELQKRGIRLFRQDETGAVTLRFHSNTWEAQSYVTGEIFRSANQ